MGLRPCLAQICQTIVYNKKHVFPLSTYHEELGVCCLSLPVVLGRNGVEQILPIQLSESEQHQLTQSAEPLRDTYNNLKKSG